MAIRVGEVPLEISKLALKYFLISKSLIRRPEVAPRRNAVRARTPVIGGLTNVGVLVGGAASPCGSLWYRDTRALLWRHQNIFEVPPTQPTAVNSKRLS